MEATKEKMFSSMYHRGEPSRPGQVVTLIQSKNSDEEVWGCAYKIATENIESVTQHLDCPERGGYKRKDVLFHPLNHSQTEEIKLFHSFNYIGYEDNPNFAGYEDIETIAGHIAYCTGVSGHNTEYLYNLAASMRIIAPKMSDEHLYELEDAVKQIEMSRKKKALEQHNLNISVK